VFTNEGVLTDGVSLAAVYGDVAVGGHFLAPYRPAGPPGKTARITRSSGRNIAELDGKPAAAVLREWVGGSIASQAEVGGNVLAQTALRPLGIRHQATGRDYYLTIHPAHIHADGGTLDVFARAGAGSEVCAMEGSVSGLVDSLDELIASAYAAGQLRAVRGGILIYCAGCAGAVGGELDRALKEKWGRAMKDTPLIGMCTFGEQGTVPGVGAIHANLSMGLILLGER
jgi:hypothetical protein